MSFHVPFDHSVCLLWRNVYLDLLLIFWLGCFFVFCIELYELLSILFCFYLSIYLRYLPMTFIFVKEWFVHIAIDSARTLLFPMQRVYSCVRESVSKMSEGTRAKTEFIRDRKTTKLTMDLICTFWWENFLAGKDTSWPEWFCSWTDQPGTWKNAILVVSQII